MSRQGGFQRRRHDDHKLTTYMKLQKQDRTFSPDECAVRRAITTTRLFGGLTLAVGVGVPVFIGPGRRNASLDSLFEAEPKASLDGLFEDED